LCGERSLRARVRCHSVISPKHRKERDLLVDVMSSPRVLWTSITMSIASTVFACAINWVYLGAIQAMAFLVALLPAVLGNSLVPLAKSLEVPEEVRRMSELVLKLSFVSSVATILALLIVLARTQQSASGIGLIVAGLAAVTTWGLMAELIHLLSFGALVRRTSKAGGAVAPQGE
jgi:hypothetical protein